MKDVTNLIFEKDLEAWEQETAEDIIRRYSTTEKERKETISSLISQREKLKDAEIEVLEAESANLQKKMDDIEHQRVLEETQCFKDIVALYRQARRKQ